MNLLTRMGVVLALVLTFGTCTMQQSGMEAKIEAQSKLIAEMQASLKALQESRRDTGRFQVMNGTPSLARSIMLVDTVTGRVWLECTTGQKDLSATVTSNWCAMQFYGVSSAP